MEPPRYVGHRVHVLQGAISALIMKKTGRPGVVGAQNTVFHPHATPKVEERGELSPNQGYRVALAWLAGLASHTSFKCYGLKPG